MKKIEALVQQRYDYYNADYEGWGSTDDYFIINELENPFNTKIMKQQPRTSHSGSFYQSKGVYTTDWIKGLKPTYTKKK